MRRCERPTHLAHSWRSAQSNLDKASSEKQTATTKAEEVERQMNDAATNQATRADEEAAALEALESARYEARSQYSHRSSGALFWHSSWTVKTHPTRDESQALIKAQAAYKKAQKLHTQAKTKYKTAVGKNNKMQKAKTTAESVFSQMQKARDKAQGVVNTAQRNVSVAKAKMDSATTVHKVRHRLLLDHALNVSSSAQLVLLCTECCAEYGRLTLFGVSCVRCRCCRPLLPRTAPRARRSSSRLLPSRQPASPWHPSGAPSSRPNARRRLRT